MRTIPFINNILKNSEFSKKVTVYFSSKDEGDDYDEFEKNSVYTNLNPITIKGYAREISPETAFWKQYGLAETKFIEFITEDKYLNYFKYCNRVVYEGEDYEVFQKGTGSQTSVTKRPYRLLRVTLSKKT